MKVVCCIKKGQVICRKKKTPVSAPIGKYCVNCLPIHAPAFGRHVKSRTNFPCFEKRALTCFLVPAYHAIYSLLSYKYIYLLNHQPLLFSSAQLPIKNLSLSLSRVENCIPLRDADHCCSKLLPPEKASPAVPEKVPTHIL